MARGLNELKLRPNMPKLLFLNNKTNLRLKRKRGHNSHSPKGAGLQLGEQH